MFKTSVPGPAQVRRLGPLLNRLMDREGRWNFDLEDRDKILRVETHRLRAASITGLLHKNGFLCEELH